MSEKSQGSFYYVIPAEVMHDKSLNLEEKLLYALISGLSNKYGYCFASNEWFEENLGVKERSLQRHLNSLTEKGYILRKLVNDEKNPFKKERHIYINTSFKKSLPDVKNDGVDDVTSFVVCEGVKNDGSVPSKMTGILSEAKKLISKDKKMSASPPPSADAEFLLNFFIDKIKERNPGFKDPNRQKWLKEFDLLLRVDKRDLEEAKKIISWASGHSFWKANCLSPSTLRKSYDKMLMQMQVAVEGETYEENRSFALAMKRKYPQQLKNLTINQKYAMNLPVGKEVPFSLPEETFRRAFLQMFGGQYEPNRTI